jgi:cytoskeletal protein CcmA (bactofilin family)
VKLTKTGYLKGQIAAKSLCVEAGGFLDAFLRIGDALPSTETASSGAAETATPPAL